MRTLQNNPSSSEEEAGIEQFALIVKKVWDGELTEREWKELAARYGEQYTIEWRRKKEDDFLGMFVSSYVLSEDELAKMTAQEREEAKRREEYVIRAGVARRALRDSGICGKDCTITAEVAKLADSYASEFESLNLSWERFTELIIQVISMLKAGEQPFEVLVRLKVGELIRQGKLDAAKAEYDELFNFAPERVGRIDFKKLFQEFYQGH